MCVIKLLATKLCVKELCLCVCVSKLWWISLCDVLCDQVVCGNVCDKVVW